jgi:hypothetical protein
MTSNIYLNLTCNKIRTIRIAQPADERTKIDLKWKTLSAAAKNKNPKFVDPVVPFKDDVVLSEFNPVYKSIYDKEKFLNS